MKRLFNVAPPRVRSGFSGIDRALLDEQLAKGVPLLRFPAVLEARFEFDTSRQRCVDLIKRGIVALILMNGFLFDDFIAVPDVFWLAVVLRLGVVTTFGIWIIMILRLNPSAFVREGLEALATLAGGSVVVILAVVSDSPFAAQYHFGLVLVLMFAIMVQRLRFWYALAATSACVLLHGVALQFIDIPPEQRFLAGSLMLGTAVFTMLAGYALERDERIAYLQSLRQRLRTAELEDLARKDPLTGLGNRRSLEQTIDWLGSEAKRGDWLSLILLDIDHFKAYNDNFGHLAGDDCLKRVGDVLTRELHNAEQTVFRFGGEEFVVLLAGIDPSAARLIAERLCRAIEADNIPHCVPVPGARLTASLGLASARSGADFQLADLTAKADTALYRAKESGRNRVVAAGDPTPPAARAA